MSDFSLWFLVNSFIQFFILFFHLILNFLLIIFIGKFFKILIFYSLKYSMFSSRLHVKFNLFIIFRIWSFSFRFVSGILSLIIQIILNNILSSISSQLFFFLNFFFIFFLDFSLSVNLFSHYNYNEPKVRITFQIYRN